MLEDRIVRLTQCILHGAAAATQLERRLRAPYGEQAAAAALLAAEGNAAAAAASAAAGSTVPAAGVAAHPPMADVATTVKGVRSAGALFPGAELEALSNARGISEAMETEADLLRRQVNVLAAELAERDRMLQTIHSMRGGGRGRGSVRTGGEDGGEDDVAMQVGGLGRMGEQEEWLVGRTGGSTRGSHAWEHGCAREDAPWHAAITCCSACPADPSFP